jgi:hypothetical protein
MSEKEDFPNCVARFERSRIHFRETRRGRVEQMLYNYSYRSIAVSTTVQISNETRRLLEKLKNEMGVKSYDEVIGKLARKESQVPKSLFGAFKGSKPFRRDPEDEHEF